MKRISWTLLTLVALLSASSLPAQAASSTIALGLWQCLSATIDVKVADGNTLISTHGDGIWNGTFNGTSTQAGQVVIDESGSWSFEANVSFVGIVAGRLGTLQMSVVAKNPAGPEAEWKGQWAILSGTGGLANLRGEGIWWGRGTPYPQVWGDVPYAGRIHSAPIVGDLYVDEHMA